MRYLARRHSRWSVDEGGAVAVMVAVCSTALLLAVALVLDLGLVRIDRQVNKSAADAATAAGIRGLDGSNGYPYAYKGVCQALTYLKLNEPGLSGLAYAPCASGTLLAKKCNPSDSSSWANFSGSAGRYEVEIRSPYTLATSGFPEESLSTMASDPGDSTQGGCDQVAVVITQTRDPGLGSLATDEDLVTRIRSVGRVIIGRDGEGAVGLLSLERNDCQVLNTSGTGSGILVKGYDRQPGVIHSDSLGNGSDCGSGSKVLNGNHARGIVAAQAPVGSPADPGVITVRALGIEPGATPANATDPVPEVIAEPNQPPSARGLLTRERVDDRYLPGLRSAVATGQSLFSPTTGITLANAASRGYNKVIGCDPAPADMAAITATDSVYVNCAGNPGFNKSSKTINGSKIFFNGKIASPPNLKMPNASEVYVKGFGGTGIDASGGLSMHNYAAASCSSLPSPFSARLIVNDGNLSSTGGLLQLCKTTVIMMGGSSTGCLPTTAGTAPTTSPCGGAGTGTLKISGTASQDWTAPNQTASTATQTLWDNQEDLALWTETYGVSSAFSMTGGGSMNLSGVFMVPNANPFNIKGGGVQTIENSQYITRKLNVTGGGTMTLGPNPRDVVTFPVVNGFTLVR